MSYSLKDGVKTALLANAGLAALVGQNIWSDFAPAGIAGVWIVMTQVSGLETGAHDGNNNLTRKRYQFTVGGDDPEKVNAVVDILTQQFHATEYIYLGNVLTFFHVTDRSVWDETSRRFSPSVDYYVWANY